MYTSFNRPHLEYASEVWGPGCSLVNGQRLGEGQLSADRIVTGLPIFSLLRKQTRPLYAIGKR